MELGAIAQIDLGEAGKRTLEEVVDLAREAITLKATAKGLLRQLSAVLDRRDVPAALRKELDDVISALRRKWSDLSGEAGAARTAAMDAEEPEESMTVMSGTGRMIDIDSLIAFIRDSETALSPEFVSELAEAELSEQRGQVMELLPSESNGDGPLRMRVALIEPGIGNSKDNHLYEADMLKRDAHIFEGVKMYATDHRKDEMSVRTEVSQILQCPAGFTETGAPIAEVGVWDPGFVTMVRNREALGVLDGLHCSIRAKGKVKKDVAFDGTKVNRVEQIIAAESVDWVTQAGAGGRALSLVESEQGTEDNMTTKTENDKDETEDTEEAVVADEVVVATLTESETEAETVQEEEVTALGMGPTLAILFEADLPKATVTRIVEGAPFASEDALTAVIAAEKAYLTEVAVKPKATRPKVKNTGRAKQPEVAVNDKSLEEREGDVLARFMPGVRRETK